MDIFLKLSAGALIAAIVSVVLAKEGKDYALILSICVCTMVLVSAATYLQTIVAFLERLTNIGGLNSELLRILLKVVGIGFVSQIAGIVCVDAGNQSLDKALKILSTSVIIWLSIPLLEELLSLIETVLEAI